jgi:hypothetical protein
MGERGREMTMGGAGRVKGEEEDEDEAMGRESRRVR